MFENIGVIPPYDAHVVLDSITEYGVRALTIEMTYPLIIHNEALTHRKVSSSDAQEYEEFLEFSRNSSSNRAIPSERIIQAVLKNPYSPIRCGKSTRGMVPGNDLIEADAEACRVAYLRGLPTAIEDVREMERLGLAKQWRNRRLTPWQFITTVFTANEELWQHFFDLRNHFAAQDEFHYVAYLAQQAYSFSIPNTLKTGMWHLPYIDRAEFGAIDIEKLQFISAARCARTSYLRQGEKLTEREDIQLAQDLLNPQFGGKPHMSPFEHQLMANTPNWRSGNMIGFTQLRKLYGQ